ncbi:hypothetical protein [Sphingomonas sp. Leaf4]|uniref:hypothetical protein n=1 Tax=Sphingomonas sp. Leaf4 TaxID=2876553 RepID=UPI001E40AA32|nr:hypothetical protein [Sphingomonas sp. Leaf4]
MAQFGAILRRQNLHRTTKQHPDLVVGHALFTTAPQMNFLPAIAVLVLRHRTDARDLSDCEGTTLPARFYQPDHAATSAL